MPCRSGLIHRVLTEFRILWRRERDADISRCPDKLPVDRNGLDRGTRLDERHRDDISRLKGDHLSFLAVRESTHGTCAEVRPQHSIECVRTAAPLQMAEHDAA